VKNHDARKKDPQWLKPTYVNRVKFDQVVYSLDWLIQLKQGAGIHFDQCAVNKFIEFVQVRLAILCVRDFLFFFTVKNQFGLFFVKAKSNL
jgi:hypothetical protein